MVLYLREITLAGKSGDPVYAKRLLLKTPFGHPYREGPPWPLQKPRHKKKQVFRVRETHVFLCDTKWSLPPESPRAE